MTKQVDIHNRLAPGIVTTLIQGTIGRGGSMGDAMVVLESVIMGVMLVVVKLGGDEIVLDTLIAGVKARLAKDRLEHIETAGRG